MDIEIGLDKPKLHNNFKIIVRNAKTGKVNQEAKAENIVLDVFYEYYFKEDEPFTPGFLCYGDGSGVPDTSRIALFNPKGCKRLTKVTKTTTPDLITQTGMIRFESTEYNGQKITEVGLGYRGNNILTHAMLKDINDNQITLGPKTEADIWEIYLTVYIERSPNMADFPNLWSDAIDINQDINIIINYTGFYLRPSNHGYTEPGVYSSIDKTRLSSLRTIETAMANTSDEYPSGYATDITQLDFPILKEPITFPNTTAFPRFDFSERTIGVGNGVVKGFTFDNGYFVEGTETVKVDGAIKNRGTDYILKQGARQPLNHPYHIPPFTNKNEVIADLKSKTTQIKKYNVGPGRTVSSLIGDNVYHLGSEIIYDLTEPFNLDSYSFSVFLRNKTDYNENVFITYSFSLDGVSWSTDQKTITQSVPRYGDSSWAYFLKRTPELTTAKYIYIKTSYYNSTAPITIVPLVGSSIIFTTPPALGQEVRASWSTEVPPKNENFTYKIQWKLKNNS